MQPSIGMCAIVRSASQRLALCEYVKSFLRLCKPTGPTTKAEVFEWYITLGEPLGRSVFFYGGYA